MPRLRMRQRFALLTCILTVGLAVGACDKTEPEPEGQGKTEGKATAAKQPEPAQPEPVRPEPAQPAQPAGEVRLQLGPGKIMPEGKPELGVTLDADGKVGLGGKQAAMTITAAGEVLSADGKRVAQVGPANELQIGGRNSGIVLDDSGLTLTSPDGRKVTMVFDHAAHAIAMEPPPGPGMRMQFEGCEGPVAKTCALVLALYLLAAEPEPT